MSSDPRAGQPTRVVPPRQGFPPGASWIGLGVVVLAILIASFVSVLPNFRTSTTTSTRQVNPGATASAGADDQGAAGGSGGSGAQGAGAAGAAGAATGCNSSQNGGSTDTGVSANSIKLASTVVESGIGQSFLGEVRFGMIAVTNQVNAGGGICGRRLDLANNLVDDGWDPGQGEQDIRNFIAEGVFAMPVVPSSQGLDQASRSGDIDRAGLPVIGTDGMLYSQYADPWIWPVSSSTISTAHIAARSAFAAGARTFGIVWDGSYRFGTEGESAFRGAIGRLPGAQLKADVKVEAGKQDYSDRGGAMNNQCGQSGCDMIFVLLEPSTAETWFATSSMHLGTKVTEGPQPLFVDTFGQNCGAVCNQMVVWTSYYPPRSPFENTPAVQQYVNAIRSVSASADIDNQFLEGGYDGMQMFVTALKKVGPNLTRKAVRQVLDGLTFDSGLSQALSWHPGNHFANTSMLSFTIQYSQGFNGFQYTQSGWVQDPWATLDHPG